MALNDITLSSDIRQNLTALQMVSNFMSRTSERLASGKRVNNPIDDPQAYFAAENHRNRAADLAARKDTMGEAIQTVKAASEGVKSITSLIQQAKGLVASARSADATGRAALATQFDDVMSQIDDLATDSGYRGTNLLGSDALTVEFNEDGSSSMTITGFDASSSGLSIAGAANAWVADTDIDAASADLDAALTSLRTQTQTLSSGTGVINARMEFTSNMINALQSGADQLTLADPNEEGANMLALQTRQQLGIVALSLSGQAQQSVLRLF